MPASSRAVAMGRAAMLKLLLVLALPFAAVAESQQLRVALQGVADRMAARYNMSLSLAFHSPDAAVAVAAGHTDAGIEMGSPRRPALPDDVYVWGSITKMFTAPAVLQLVERGLVALGDPITKHVDPVLKALNGTTLADRFGPRIQQVQIHHLLHMTSGIADYDGEAFARDQFANRSRSFGPVEILGYVDPTLRAPGKQAYCSTNYILLGLVLAGHYHTAGQPWSWQAYDQMSVIPKELQSEFRSSKFVDSGICKEYTPVHGFMDSYSTAKLPPQDVWNLSCNGGWTAGNYLGSTADVARFTYDLYSVRNPLIVSAASQKLLTDFKGGMFGFKFYGMGTFSLDWSVGDATAYGHAGDTYGYQSQTTYFPDRDFALAVATNVELGSQAQPADTICSAYHEVIAALDGTTPPSCTFTVFKRFIGKCRCHHGGSIFV